MEEHLKSKKHKETAQKYNEKYGLDEETEKKVMEEYLKKLAEEKAEKEAAEKAEEMKLYVEK